MTNPARTAALLLAICSIVAGCNGDDDVSVTGRGLAALRQRADNTPPTISGKPATSAAPDQSYTFQPSASDRDGDKLSFFIENQPDWAQFDSKTGRLSGKPDATSTTQRSVRIGVSDGKAHAMLPSFDIRIVSSGTAGGGAPSISGAPTTTVLTGNAYAFVPTASDPDGDVLTFSVAGLPAWATFDSSSGSVSGRPEAGDVGTYAGIAISVTDGTSTASLAAFAIDVVPTATGTATVSWAPPSQNVDGSPLTDLAGFRVYYGKARDSLTERLDVPNSGLTTIVVENLTPATWYFGVRAYSATNIESDLSAVANKTIM
jgi:Putative Ig domain